MWNVVFCGVENFRVASRREKGMQAAGTVTDGGPQRSGIAGVHGVEVVAGIHSACAVQQLVVELFAKSTLLGHNPVHHPRLQPSHHITGYLTTCQIQTRNYYL